MLKNLNMSSLMKEAHRLTKEFVEEYGVDYKVQLGLFISYLIEEVQEIQEIINNGKVENEKQLDSKLMEKIDQIIVNEKLENFGDMITFEQWFEDYQSNNLYNYIFYNNNILAKNGKTTIDSKKDAKNTSAFYQILPSEAEDIKQLALLKVMERFERVGGTIERKHRFSVWSIACLNATKQHNRHLTRFKAYNQDSYTNIVWDNGSTTVLYDDDYSSLLRLDIERVLTDRQMEISDLLEQGYNKVEIAEIVGISRQAVHKNIRNIKQIMIENGLVIGY